MNKLNFKPPTLEINIEKSSVIGYIKLTFNHRLDYLDPRKENFELLVRNHIENTYKLGRGIDLFLTLNFPNPYPIWLNKADGIYYINDANILITKDKKIKAVCTQGYSVINPNLGSKLGRDKIENLVRNYFEVNPNIDLEEFIATTKTFYLNLLESILIDFNCSTSQGIQIFNNLVRD